MFALRAAFLATAALALSGCAQLLGQVYSRTQIEHAEPIGMIPNDTSMLPQITYDIMANTTYSADQRNLYVEAWMTRSDQLCRNFKDQIISVARGERLATGITSGILSGLATIFSQIGTVHPLTGAATIVTGIGGSLSSDTFAQQTGDVLAAAIETARQNQANQIEANLKSDAASYNIYRAQRDVQAYHDMCSLETALNQIRSSLKATAPDAGGTPQAAQGIQVQTSDLAPALQPTTPTPVGTPHPIPVGAPQSAADFLRLFMAPPGATDKTIAGRLARVERAQKDLGFTSPKPEFLPLPGADQTEVRAVAKSLGWSGQ
jgi:hypothetical protein